MSTIVVLLRAGTVLEEEVAMTLGLVEREMGDWEIVRDSGNVFTGDSGLESSSLSREADRLGAVIWGEGEVLVSWELASVDRIGS